MQIYIALLRAVNVGGTGKLPMSELKQMALDCGFISPKTYINSGNIAFKSDLSKEEAYSLLKLKLDTYLGKPSELIIKTISELEATILENPFKECQPNRVLVYYSNDEIIAGEGVKNQKFEEIIQTKNNIFIHYGEGMADSKLSASWLKNSTGRNINTISKMINLCAELLP